jgi:Fic-DOC domain mobile mystery protein B
LDPQEAEGLLLPIATQAALNEAEYRAVLTARLAVGTRRISLGKFLTISSLTALHREMFDGIWEWAGQFRRTEKNLGVAPHQIQVQLHQLAENISARVANPRDDMREIAATFHHRLVAIHPFVNGNGRHARLATELLCRAAKGPRPTWPDDRELVGDTPARTRYIDALRAADGGDLTPLLTLLYP